MVGRLLSFWEWPIFRGHFSFRECIWLGKVWMSITRKGDTGMNGDLFTCGWLDVSLALSLSSSWWWCSCCCCCCKKYGLKHVSYESWAMAEWHALGWFGQGIPSRKPTWQWKITILNRWRIFKRLLFRCHVRFRGCMCLFPSKENLAHGAIERQSHWIWLQESLWMSRSYLLNQKCFMWNSSVFSEPSWVGQKIGNEILYTVLFRDFSHCNDSHDPTSII